MGNSSSSSARGHHDETVDYGVLVSQGVYTGPHDWNQAVVSQSIVARRLAPFYRPLEDYNTSWDDDQILAARKEFPVSDHSDTVSRTEPSYASSTKSKRSSSLKESVKPEAQVYRGAVECPICFLYYPPNINRSRCCDQAICTECFVQIKRIEPTTTHLVSEPAACPYCVEENFGIVYTPPPWRAGLGSEHGGSLSETRSLTEPTPPTHKRRQKSYSANSPEVVLIDHIRPDWESKLEAVRAAVARRANRRIIMRQVGDRLIPVGVTSGRVHALSPEEASAVAASVENGSRRDRRRGRGGGDTLDHFMGMTGPDLEELMLMEAMRLSLLDHEEHQRKEAEEKRKREAAALSGIDSESGGANPSVNGPSSSSVGTSTSETQTSFPTSSSSCLSTAPPLHPRTPSPASHLSQDGPTPGRTSWSISRSRTPPPPTNPSSSMPVPEDSQATWRNRTEGPQPFSTLSAALTTTSTAAAVLGNLNPDLASTSKPVTENACSLSVENTVPAISTAGGSALNHTIGVSDHTSIHSDAPLPPLPVEEIPSTMSSASTDEPPTSGSTPTTSSSSFDSMGNGKVSHKGLPHGSESPGSLPLLNSDGHGA